MADLDRIRNHPAYELVEERYLEDIYSQGMILRHKKTGARLVLIKNEDENKVFFIGFRTPPKDSTGVAHILEHSVLCGSRDFPIKDPFVELVKGSLNTFINAMTYPDKTIYPVASCNDKDFENLMHVYLDAVFYPRIYDNPNIFYQEGWHYEINDEGQPEINGVVYNEMKGAFSSPDDVLEREIMNSLFPDTPYGVESGGDPANIPDLTYEDFLKFHADYYHPSNSYIYLYGNMDMEERLSYLDEAYLSAFDRKEIDSEPAGQPAFREAVRVVKNYPIGEEEDEEGKTHFSLNVLAGESLNGEHAMAFRILDYALCSAPGAPLKKRLMEKGIGKDVYSSYEDGIRQPYFSIVAKYTDLDREEEFLEAVRGVLEQIIAEGFDEKALLAGLNYYEFKYREADFGSYPKGLMYGLKALDGWLYDDRAPFLYLETNEVFADLRRKVSERYFEALCRQYLLNNPHRSLVILRPEKGLASRMEQELKERLRVFGNGLSAGEMDRIQQAARALTQWQEEEDKPEDLARIPLLKREDLRREAHLPVNEERMVGETRVLCHELPTNGIAYVRLIFDIGRLDERLYPYAGFFKNILGLLDTDNYGYGELFNEINIVTGGMSAVNNVYGRVNREDEFRATLELKTKVLYANLEKAMDLFGEIILSTKFDGTRRLYEILGECKARMEAQLMSQGHSAAVGRAMAYGTAVGVLNEELGGIRFYRWLVDLERDYENRKEELVQAMKTLSGLIFTKGNLMVDYAGEESGWPLLESSVAKIYERLYTDSEKKPVYRPSVFESGEGFMSAGQVQYVCRAGNFVRKGLPYTGALRILKVMLGYEYLWTNVRVKGGAYGCMCSFSRLGNAFFVSYRDPNLRKTLEVYEKTAQAIEAFDADERTMTQYIIGAISDLDVPMPPSAKAIFSLSAYMGGITDEMFQREREELLDAGVEDIRSLSSYVKAFMEDGWFCVVGNADKLKEEKDLFRRTENLF